MISGKPISSAKASASSTVWAMTLSATGSPIRCEQILEQLAVFGGADRLDGRAQDLHVVAFEDAAVGELDGQVEAGLAAEAGEQRVGPLAGDDQLEELGGERLDVGPIGDVRVGHDRGRVGVDQDRGVAFFAQGAAGLGAGVVELGGLADDDRARADDHDFHAIDARQTAGSRRTGPGCPAGRGSLRGGTAPRRPAARGGAGLRREPSFRLTCETSKPLSAGNVSATTWNSWFWVVMVTRPLARSRTGWLPPWWPYSRRLVVGASGQAEQLVAEADAHQRRARADQRCAARRRRVASLAGRPGRSRRRMPFGRAFEDLVGRGIPGDRLVAARRDARANGGCSTSRRSRDGDLVCRGAQRQDAR